MADECVMHGVQVRVVTRRMSPSHRTAVDAHLAEVEAEQAALRRIAALLARSVAAEEVFDAVVDEARLLMGVEAAALVRYEADNTATPRASPDRARSCKTRGRVVSNGPHSACLFYEDGGGRL